VWRQLAFGAHHDAITGSEADQVYIDLLTGWREAYDLARGARDAAATAIVRRVDTTGEGSALVVFNTLAFDRTEPVRAEVDTSHGVRVLDDAGDDVPVVVEAPGVIRFVARDVPSMGWRTYRVADGGSSAGWTDVDGSVTVESDAYRISRRRRPRRDADVRLRPATGPRAAHGTSGTSFASTRSMRRTPGSARARGTCCPTVGR
jgi:hypothetical protein